MNIPSVFEESFRVTSRVDLRARASDFSMKVVLRIVEKPALSSPFGISFIDENIFDILPKSENEVPRNSEPVSILAPKN